MRGPANAHALQSPPTLDPPITPHVSLRTTRAICPQLKLSLRRLRLAKGALKPWGFCFACPLSVLTVRIFPSAENLLEVLQDVCSRGCRRREELGQAECGSRSRFYPEAVRLTAGNRRTSARTHSTTTLIPLQRGSWSGSRICALSLWRQRSTYFATWTGATSVSIPR